jgi:hypothetical protein
MSSGVGQRAIFRHAATQVEKILIGQARLYARTAPMKLEFIINGDRQAGE